MALNQEIKERIYAAADELHAASETGEYPSVEAVRQLSRAGMNNVVEAMKGWRQAQRKQVQSVREPLPAGLLAVLQTSGQGLADENTPRTRNVVQSGSFSSHKGIAHYQEEHHRWKQEVC